MIHDDNGPGCPSAHQCILVRIRVGEAGQAEARLEIAEETGAYVVSGDLSALWTDPNVQAVDARLQRVRITLAAHVAGPGGGAHIVVRNPASAGTYTFTYTLTSWLDGSKHPDGCSPSCTIDLGAVEYPPSVATPALPAADAATTTATAVPFAWARSIDPNGDQVSYTLRIRGPGTSIDVPTSNANATVSGLVPGEHTWWVDVSANGAPVTGEAHARPLLVIDPAASCAFRSAHSSDVLYVSSAGGFVYWLGGTPAGEHGARAPGLDRPSGTITYAGAFRLVVAYDEPGSAASGVLTDRAGRVHAFSDPPG